MKYQMVEDKVLDELDVKLMNTVKENQPIRVCDLVRTVYNGDSEKNRANCRYRLLKLEAANFIKTVRYPHLSLVSLGEAAFKLFPVEAAC